MKRKWIWVAAPVALVLSLLAVVYALRTALIAPRLEALIRESARGQLGLEVSIGHIGGSLLADVEVRDVITVAPAVSGALSSLDIKRLVLRYSLASLWDGLSAFVRSASLTIEGLRVEADLGRRQNSEPGEAASASFPLTLPVLDIRDAAVHIRAADLRLDLLGLHLETGAASPVGRPVRLQVPEFSWSHPRIRPGSTSVVADLSLTPDAVRIDALLLAGEPLVEEAHIDFTGQPDRIPFAARLKLGGGRLNLQGESTAASLRAEVKAQDVQLARVAEFFALPGEGRLDLEAAVSLPAAGAEEIAGRVGMTIREAAFRDVRGAELRLEACVADGRLKVPALALNARGSSAILTDADASWAELVNGRFEQLLEGLSGEFSLDSENVPSLLRLAGITAQPAQARTPPHRLVLSGRAAGSRLFVPTAVLTTPAGGIHVRNLETSLPPAGADTYLSADVLLRLTDLAAAASILGTKPLGGTLNGKITVSGSVGRLKGQALLKGTALVLDGLPLGDGSLQAAADSDTVRVESLALRSGRGRLEAQGSFDLGTKRLGPTRVVLEADEIADYLRAFAPGWQVVSGRAAGRLEAAGPLDEPVFSLDLRVGRLNAAGNALEQLHLTALGDGRRIRVESGEARTALGRLRLAGDVNRRPEQGIVDVALEELDITGEDFSLALESPARIQYASPGAVTVSGFAAGGPQGGISVRGRLAFAGSSDLRVQLMGLNGGGWIPRLTGVPLVLEGLDADVHAAGSAAAPEIDAVGTIKRLGALDSVPAYGGRFSLGYSGGRLRVDALDLDGPEGHRVSLTGSLPLDPSGARLLAPGPLTLTGTARVADLASLQALWPAWPFASGSLEADLSLRGSWRDPDGQLRVIGRDLRPSEDSAIPPGPYEASGEAGFRDGRLAIHHLGFKAAAGRLEVLGEMTGIPPLPQLVAGDSPPDRAQVSLNGQLTIADLGWLARRIGGVRRASGRLEARMAVNGPLHEPAMEGDVRLADGALRPEADIPPFQALNLEARLSGRTLEIGSFKGEMGGAPFVLSGRLENIFTPLENGRADLRLDGKNLLFYRSDAIRLRADANLTVSGPIPRMTLAGGIIVADGFFGKNLGLLEGLEAGSSRTIARKGIELFSITAAPFSDTVFDVDITAAAPFEIKNNLARAAVRPDLHLNGTGRAPELTGKIYFEPSTLFLPAGRMQLQSGLVRFDASDPGRPNLALVATARMLGYDVTAVAEGPYDEPTVTLSSVPPIPDSELLMLVLTGQAPKTTGARASEGGRNLNVAVFFGRDMITRIEGDDSTETLQSILERFDVEVGRFVTRAGDETINAEFRLADNVLRGGDTLYLTAEKDIYDYYNAGIKIVFRFR